jgi:hypothetical protein
MPEAAFDRVHQITETLADEGCDEKASAGAFTAKAKQASEAGMTEQSDVYDFDSFIQRMRHASCKPILENIKR